MLLQQGDVLLKRVENLPLNGKEIKRQAKGFVLAEGEVTGHAHVIEDEIQMVEKDGILYIGCKTDVIVKHEEHGHITVPAGIYEVGIVKEYDHFAEEARKVAD